MPLIHLWYSKTVERLMRLDIYSHCEIVSPNGLIGNMIGLVITDHSATKDKKYLGTFETASLYIRSIKPIETRTIVKLHVD